LISLQEELVWQEELLVAEGVGVWPAALRVSVGVLVVIQATTFVIK
jgi:hypothetical protein